MATVKQIQAFIEEVAPCAQYAYKTLGKVHPSVCIAMACVESAYGTSQIMRLHNAFMGQKVGTGKTATTYWSGKFYTSKTSEEYTIGVHTTIKAAFRAYDNMQQCILNYYELLNTALYKKVLSTSSPKIQMLQIRACGYMTSSTEVNSVLKLIDKYNLTQYDSAQTTGACPYPEPTTTLRIGSAGSGVKWLQWMINRCGLGYDINEDGIYGNITAGAVIDFEKKMNLTVDEGLAGPQVRTTLKKMVKEG